MQAPGPCGDDGVSRYYIDHFRNLASAMRIDALLTRLLLNSANRLSHSRASKLIFIGLMVAFLTMIGVLSGLILGFFALFITPNNGWPAVLVVVGCGLAGLSYGLWLGQKMLADL